MFNWKIRTILSAPPPVCTINLWDLDVCCRASVRPPESWRFRGSAETQPLWRNALGPHAQVIEHSKPIAGPVPSGESAVHHLTLVCACKSLELRERFVGISIPWSLVTSMDERDYQTTHIISPRVRHSHIHKLERSAAPSNQLWSRICVPLKRNEQESGCLVRATKGNCRPECE